MVGNLFVFNIIHSILYIVSTTFCIVSIQNKSFLLVLSNKINVINNRCSDVFVLPKIKRPSN